ncbi:MAG: FKBP-type peptidyl-prolyl cis-trans isomerase [Lachnospiraceae bacterium]|nr:FKBP-type peptidyl-prolyl cis-trans isomerase [Lachnospiraceae bacterium]
MSSQKAEMKRQRRAKALRKEKAKKSVRNIVIGVVVLALVALIGYIVYYKTVLVTQPIGSYSEGLAEDGTIAGVVAKDYVSLGQYDNIQVDYSEIAPEPDVIDGRIDSVLEANMEYSTEEGIAIELYDRINLDYVGKIDGVAFEGGSTAEGGTVIVVGEAGYIDDFEEQLIGHKTGSSFDIEVTFPEDYGNTEVAGKDAVFSITINGIYTKPVFDDAFVKEHLSEYALTADAYRKYLEDEASNVALESYVQTYLSEHCMALSYPEEYVEIVMGKTKYTDQQEFEYMNEYYSAYFGSGMYKSLADYKGAENELEYEAALRLRAEDSVEAHMIIQAIYEEKGLVVTSEHLDAVMEDLGSTSEFMVQMEEMYGKGYIYQLAINKAVIEYLMENAVINK